MRCFLHEVGGVVGRQQPHPTPALGRGQARDQVGLLARRQREEEILGLFVGNHLEAEDAVFLAEQRPGVAQLLDGETLLQLHGAR